MTKSSLSRVTATAAATAMRPAFCRRAPRVAFASLPVTSTPSSTSPSSAPSARRAYHISSSRRPRIQGPASASASASAQPSWSLAGPGRRSIFIQTESTPNADALKFLPNHRVLPEGIAAPFVEYLSPRATIAPPYPSPLAAQLMNVDGVTAVFYGSDFITVTKAQDANWAHIRPEVFALITEAITSGQQIVRPAAEAAAGAAAASGSSSSSDAGGAPGAPVEADSLQYDENDSEVVGMIKELLETRIRPAIQEDGGDIEFRGFENGTVKLKLRGACRTCDSSTVTLKNGIESMLMHYIEEVEAVEQVLDQEEEIALSEFAKFEEKLKGQRGPAVAAT
ncbi:hypothetical protein SPBR_03977 [Sporothrix brasiliensis 5110]|uniref:Scaffold protein Nfu/NifU N-terminal domain-containing protein n=1 Tax=Sporothrix brasiliensis 5110 TaxID=1398154 RepID=A0A0C2J885_9PEZI|nr:uncharacterized protein SPBR_03977 [Sporothrix brasiliensis 5110]KIH95225.1 hypothetical protein SPBR_03977 [Sporothrix brasiliensis 5110]